MKVVVKAKVQMKLTCHPVFQFEPQVVGLLPSQLCEVYWGSETRWWGQNERKGGNIWWWKDLLLHTCQFFASLPCPPCQWWLLPGNHRHPLRYSIDKFPISNSSIIFILRFHFSFFLFPPATKRSWSPVSIWDGRNGSVKDKWNKSIHWKGPFHTWARHVFCQIDPISDNFL